MVSLVFFFFVSLNKKNFFCFLQIYAHDRKNGFMSKENSYFLSAHNFNSIIFLLLFSHPKCQLYGN
jgi:hypothetical protein